MTTRTFLLLLVCLTLTSCLLRPYKVDVQQGNYIDHELIGKLKPGMTRSQVRFLLGTPLIADPFHPERWDYLFLDRTGGRLKEERRLTLWFEGDKLKRAVTDTAPAAPVAAAAQPAPAVVPKPAAAAAKTSGTVLPTKSAKQSKPGDASNAGTQPNPSGGVQTTPDGSATAVPAPDKQSALEAR